MVSAFLIINEVEQLFTLSLVIRSFSLIKDLLKFFTHFYIEGFCLSLTHRISLYVLVTSLLPIPLVLLTFYSPSGVFS